jgi:hypothetical protein
VLDSLKPGVRVRGLAPRHSGVAPGWNTVGGGDVALHGVSVPAPSHQVLFHSAQRLPAAALRSNESFTDPQWPASEHAPSFGSASQPAMVAACPPEPIHDEGTTAQRVQDQQVDVSEGGQALVAGKVGRGSRRGGKANMDNEPLTQRRGWLRNGTAPGNFLKVTSMRRYDHWTSRGETLNHGSLSYGYGRGSRCTTFSR